MAVHPTSPLETSSKNHIARFKHLDLTIPIVKNRPEQVVYRTPTRLSNDGTIPEIRGDVFAILAGSGRDGFVGARLNFRDVINEGRQSRAFVYVVSTDEVTANRIWQGYVRLGYKKWVRLPVPRPQAIYNRIPTRALERNPSGLRARDVVRRVSIPMFNPNYFSKPAIYEAIRRHGLSVNLPETVAALDQPSLLSMCERHGAVYLKPAGGSVGHGMIRVDAKREGYSVSVLKNGKTQRFTAASGTEMWQIVARERVAGKYVTQQAIRLVEFRGQPCDFRVLAQKRDDEWTLAGIGVRVSGKGKITTHVPNGGSIAHIDAVLSEAFGQDAAKVEQELEAFAIRAANAIDAEFGRELGEMSMDIGIDASGKPWFFEANAKPMKFDEPDIRSRSLRGVIEQLRFRARR